MAEDMKKMGGKKSGADESHGDNTAPAGIDSPATFTPLATETSSVNQKTETGRKGPVEG
jgi:hypothetical protein